MDPVMIDLPEEIETERLSIRPCRPGDGQLVKEAIDYSREELKAWLPFAHTIDSAEETEARVRSSYAKFISREDIRLHIFRKSDGNFIGSTGLHRLNWDIPKVEIGYWIDSRYARQGYMTEAVKGLIQFAFSQLGAKRIEIRCDPDNRPSRAIPERLGFILEGILRNDSLSADGKSLRSTCVFSLLPEDWKPDSGQ